MTKLDQFESVFRAAVKDPFRFEEVPLERVAVVTDLDRDLTGRFSASVRSFLSHLGGVTAWVEVPGERYRSVADLLALVESERADLVATYRNLHEEGGRCRFGLGVHLDALTQATDVPILVLPEPTEEGALSPSVEGARTAMVVTDHLSGDHRLVSVAARFTEPGGTLCLAHIEDDAVFRRYLGAIAKIPTIDTEDARSEIRKVLLGEAADFIASCAAKLEGCGLVVDSVVDMGHHLTHYKRLIEQKRVDLLVFNTKDESQLAMHGLAHPLAVEVRGVPLLML